MLNYSTIIDAIELRQQSIGYALLLRSGTVSTPVPAMLIIKRFKELGRTLKELKTILPN